MKLPSLVRAFVDRYPIPFVGKSVGGSLSNSLRWKKLWWIAIQFPSLEKALVDRYQIPFVGKSFGGSLSNSLHWKKLSWITKKSPFVHKAFADCYRIPFVCKHFRGLISNCALMRKPHMGYQGTLSPDETSWSAINVHCWECLRSLPIPLRKKKINSPFMRSKGPLVRRA